MRPTTAPLCTLLLALIALSPSSGLAQTPPDAASTTRGWDEAGRPLTLAELTTQLGTEEAASVRYTVAVSFDDGQQLNAACIVSSDSDFTRLAARIREQGLVVYGFGERKTPQPFVAACDKFIYTELLGDDEEKPAKSVKKSTPTLKKDRKLASLLRQAVDSASDDSGWAQLGAIGSNLQRLAPDFDSRTYGYRKLRDLVQAQGGYLVEERPGGDGRGSAVYIRAR